MGRGETDENKSRFRYQIVIPFIFDGKQFIVSLYAINEEVDVSDIAVKYGGGWPSWGGWIRM